MSQTYMLSSWPLQCKRYLHLERITDIFPPLLGGVEPRVCPNLKCFSLPTAVTRQMAIYMYSAKINHPNQNYCMQVHCLQFITLEPCKYIDASAVAHVQNKSCLNSQTSIPTLDQFVQSFCTQHTPLRLERFKDVVQR